MARCTFWHMLSATTALRCRKNVHKTDIHECLDFDDDSSGPWTDPRKEFETADSRTVKIVRINRHGKK